MITLLQASAGQAPWMAIPSPNWALSLVVFVIGIIILMVGASKLIRGSQRLAFRLGVSPLTIGLSVIAFGTSAPELTLNVVSAFTMGDAGTRLAFGNVVGSNTANIALVLGFTCLFYTITVRDHIAKLWYPLLLVVEVLLLVSAVLLTEVSRLEGICLLILLPMVVMLMYKRGLSNEEPNPVLMKNSGAEEELFRAGDRPTAIGLVIGLVGVGLVLLFAGSISAGWGAVNLARGLGLSEVVIGLTVVAVATSLPEGFVTFKAAKKREFDLVMGTVIGSNLFNIVSVLAITSIVRPVPLSGNGNTFLVSVFSMFGFTLLAGWFYRHSIISRFNRAIGRGSDQAHGSSSRSLGRGWGVSALLLWISVTAYFIVTGSGT